MSVRRTVAPDIAGCTFVLLAATLSFAVLRAPFIHQQAGAMATDLLVYGGLMCTCLLVAAGLFLRKLWAFFPGIVLSGALIVASVQNWHMPETGQLPAGVLGITAVLMLVLRYREFVGGVAAQSTAVKPDDE